MMDAVNVVFEDDAVLVLLKPAGMIVNNADTARHQYTLHQWVEEYLGSAFFQSDTEFSSRSGIVHRLDKETSGIILVAKSENVFQNLQLQFKERLVKKTYVALAHGELPDEGEISVPIGRLPWNRMRFGVIPDGRPATTSFETIAYYTDPDASQSRLTYVRLFPKTGRTHQIRVHLQYAGHPIYADPFYAGRKIARRDRARLPRHFLHAEGIEFMHPMTKASVNFVSRLPKDLEEFLASLAPAVAD